MVDIKFNRKDIKFSLLDEELRKAVAGYRGATFVYDTGDITVHIDPVADTEAVKSSIEAIITAHDPTAQTALEKTVETIKTTAQSAEGVSYTSLTASQQLALLAVLLWKAGALAPDGTIKPLKEWV